MIIGEKELAEEQEKHLRKELGYFAQVAADEYFKRKIAARLLDKKDNSLIILREFPDIFLGKLSYCCIGTIRVEN